MNRQTRKFFSWILVLCLVASFAFSSTALAAELPEPEPAATESAATQTPEAPAPEPETELVVTTAEDEVVATAEPTEEQPVAAQQQDAVSAAELLAIAEQDGAQAALLLNAYTDNAAFEDVLRQILDLYYSKNLTAQLQAFESMIDSRAEATLVDYRQAQAERASDDLGYVAGEVLVQFKASVAEPQAQTAMESHDSLIDDLVETPAEEIVAVVDIPLDQTVDQAVAELSADPAVAHAQPNYIYQRAETAPEPKAFAASLPSDPEVDKLWHMNKINTAEAWDIVDARGGSRVRVAILDEMADITHEDLSANINASLCYDMQSGVAQPYPTTGFAQHGTHVAGITGAVANNSRGVAGVGSGSYNQVLEMMLLNVFDSKGAKTSVMIAAISKAVTDGAKVINMSLGYEQETASNWDTLLEDAINSAVAQNVTVVAAAGNYNNSKPFFPSDFNSVIGVISTVDYTDPTSSSCKTSSSNYGANKTISAPGSNIYGAYPANAYGTKSGTSMAAPVVTGVVAMLYYLKPSITPNEVKDILTSTATDLHTPGFDEQTAWGNVNAYRAVMKVLGITVPGTPTNLVASPESLTSIRLSWDAVSGVSGYNIYRSESETGTFSLLHTILSPSTVTYTDNVPDPDKKYYYKVSAFTVSGSEMINGAAAGPVSASVGWPAPQNFKALKTSGATSVTLSWDAVAGVEGYKLFRSEKMTSDYSNIYTGTATNYVDNAITSGKTYYYYVIAYGKQGGVEMPGAKSVTITVPFISIPPNVAGLTATSTGYNSVQLEWTAVSDIDGYTVYRSTTSNGTYTQVKDTQETTFEDTALGTGREYFYKVYAYRVIGNSKEESESSTVASATPVNAEPAGLTAAGASSTSIKISWKKSPGASGYDIYRATTKNGQYKRIATNTGANKVAYMDKNLKLGQTFYYKVTPFRNMASGKVQGNTAGPVAGTAAPAPPANLKGSVTDDSFIKLTWSKSAGASGYMVYRSTNKSSGYKAIKSLRTTSYTDKKLNPGTTYYYRVLAYADVSGSRAKGATTTSVGVKTDSVRVSGLTATAVAHNKIKLSWSGVANAEAYQIYRKEGSGAYKFFKSTKGKSFTDSTVTTGREYFYKVRSYRIIDGQKAFDPTFSTAAKATTAYGKPNYTAAISGGTATVTSIPFSMTNTGSFDLVILPENAKVVDDPDKTSANDRTLTIWEDDKQITEERVLKPGERIVLSFRCSSSTPYTPNSHLQFRFTYDGRTYQNTSCYNKSPKHGYVVVS